MRVVFLSIFLALTALAQQDGFAVDEQGRAWFTTSLSPRDSDIEQKSRLFALTPSGLQIVAESSMDSLGATAIVFPGASSDGNTLAWNERFPYYVITSLYSALTGVVVRRTRWFDGRITHPGFVSISRNGVWAIWINANALAYGSLWVNLSTGEEFPLPSVLPNGESVAADGSVVRPDQTAVEVFTPTGSVDRIPTTFAPFRPLISADARHLLVNSVRALFHYDRDLREWTTVDAECGSCGVRALSPDGAHVVYVRDSTPREIHLTDLRARTTSTIALTNDQITALQFSDDGSMLWVMTSGLELLRIDAATGDKTVVMPPSPVLTRPPSYAAPGSRVRIDGGGLATATVSLNGRPLQIIDRGPGWLQPLLPADLPLAPAQWSLDSPGALFQTPLAPVEIVPQFPQFIQLRDLGESDPIWTSRYLVFGATDGGLINPERPAIPGEELLLWMTGLNGDTSLLDWTVRSFADNGQELGLEQAITIDGVEPDPFRPGWWIARLHLPAATPRGHAYVTCQPAGLPDRANYAGFPIGSSPGSSSSESSK